MNESDMRIAYDELVPEGEEVACVAVAPTLHDARKLKSLLENAHIDFAIECEPHATFQLANHEHPRAAFFVAASDVAHALAALRQPTLAPPPHADAGQATHA